MVVVFGFKRIILAAYLHPGDIAKAYLGAVFVDAQQNIAELLGGLQSRLDDDAGVDFLSGRRRRAAELAGGNLRVLAAYREHHVFTGHRIGGQLLGVQPNTHRILRAEQLNGAHAIDATERFANVCGHIVGNVVLIHAVVTGHKADDHQKARRGFVHANPLLLDFLRQQRHGPLQLILHLYLGYVGVGASFEGNGDLTAAAGITHRLHIFHVVDAGDVLLDDLDHRVFNGLRRSAGVVGADRHRGRCHLRVLSHRQAHNGDDSGEHDDDRNHPGEYRPINKKAGHAGLSPIVSE